MNVFVIPSWYPSPTNPLPGIFFRDQAKAMAKLFNDINVGISIWGQNDERLLLWSKSTWSSLKKLITKPRPYIQAYEQNLVEYFTPAYTWSSKIVDGNLKAIVKANLLNMKQFESTYGKIDIIHAHVGFPGGYIAQQISKKQNTPYVITEHMSPFPHAQFLDSKNELSGRLTESYQKSIKTICVSHSLENQVYAFGISNTTVIPNLVDRDFFHLEFTKSKNEKFTFFSLGRMVHQKGIDVLIKAFANLNSNALLRIGGDGASLKDYKALAKKTGVDHRIQWLGELDKKSTLLEFQRCDAFVLPSRHESMGVVFAEAMACGKPVIATICGGPEEFLDDDSGYLVAPEDVNGLTASMQKMMRNYQFFTPIKIRKHAESRFSKEVICTQIKEVYENIIESFN
jgi:glycosyltransferase involved in cell wall biosynthesis